MLKRFVFIGFIGLSLCISVSANEIQEAHKAYFSNNIVKAEKIFTKLCKKGNFDACVGCMNLGSDYLNGIDYTKAKKLLELSCNVGGVGVGCSMLGKMYYGGYGVVKNIDIAGSYANKACNSKDNYGTGQRYFGCALEGQILMEKSFISFSKACETGNTDACDVIKSVAGETK